MGVSANAIKRSGYVLGVPGSPSDVASTKTLTGRVHGLSLVGKYQGCCDDKEEKRKWCEGCVPQESAMRPWNEEQDRIQGPDQRYHHITSVHTVIFDDHSITVTRPRSAVGEGVLMLWWKASPTLSAYQLNRNIDPNNDLSPM